VISVICSGKGVEKDGVVAVDYAMAIPHPPLDVLILPMSGKEGTTTGKNSYADGHRPSG
jgi:hypothetical protein